ncbi:MAG TPA: ABC transporter permease subunit [Hyphomicrobiales bacterium]|nr:ABC transporter permease subunit [Hyphomicrobiales bacterium]
MSREATVAWARAALIAASIALLEVLCRLQIINPLTLLPPSQMASALAELLISGQMVNDIAQTFSTVAAAFALAAIFGFALGAVAHTAPRLRRLLDPLLASYYSIPFFVFYPLLIAIFGLNRIPLAVIGLIFAAAAMALATLNGLDRVQPALKKTAKTMGLSRLQAILFVIIPATVPYLFTGLKLALAYAFIGVIAGEFILSGAGLGYAIAYAYNNFDNRTMYATMLFVLIVAAALNGLLQGWEHRILKRRGLK